MTLPWWLQRCGQCGQRVQQVDAHTWRCPQLVWVAATRTWEHA